MGAWAASEGSNLGIAGELEQTVGINSLWVVLAGMVVMFMQAGFAFLEIGFSRGKNAGTVIAKILTNFSIAAVGWWICGFAFAFSTGELIGHSAGFFFTDLGPFATEVDGTTLFSPEFGVMSLSDATIESKFFFQFVFCAVSLAIVWGTTLERIKFGAYVIYAFVFSMIIYPIGAHWVFGGGFLQVGDWLGTGIVGMQDFAGSTAVHLIGATGALAALLLLGPRRGKYGPDGKPRAIPGHNMPLFGLGVLILWLGWFGFNPGSTLNALDGRFPEILIITNLAAAAGVLAAVTTAKLRTGSIDIGMAGNGAIAGLVAITAPSGYVELWAAPIIGAVAGVIVVLGVYAIDKLHRRPGRRPVGARPGRHLGNARLRAVHRAAARPVQRVRRPRGRPVLLGQLRPADRAGRRLRDRLHVRVHHELHDVLADQEDHRPPRLGGRGGRRAGHLRARDVRIPRAVHPAGGVSGRRQPDVAARSDSNAGAASASTMAANTPSEA